MIGHDQDAHRLLSLIRDLLLELRAGGRVPEVRLDSALDRELGLDSLSRVELLVRVERGFGVELPERLIASAETPADLLDALLQAAPAGLSTTGSAPLIREGEGDEIELPLRAETLNEVLEWHTQRHPERIHIHLHEGEREEPIRYRELHEGALRVAGALAARGLRAGQTVAIMLPTGRDYLFSFFGTLLAGGVPVPIYPPVRPSQLEEHLRRHAAILDNAQAAVLITVPEARIPARLLQAQVASLRHVVEPLELGGGGGAAATVRVRAGDIAFLQYTSGSTGTPKGVTLTHADLLANIRAMGEVVDAGPQDCFVSWLPLYHDMGLIGAWLGSLYFACPLVLMSPLTFLARPRRWLQAISDHRGTLSGAPNFAYELCVNRIDEVELAGLDLSSWRFAFNGAEPVSANTLRRFTERFAPCGLDPGALAPVYGLAEAAVGLAFPPPGRGPRIDRIRRDALVARGEAVPAEGEGMMEVVACGRPLPGYEIRVCDAGGRELPERREGRVQFRGPSATQGYYRNPTQTAQLITADGWHESGDLGYLAGGDIYLTSRSKDLIIRAGRNIYPAEVEEAVGLLEGIRQGCVVMFGANDPGAATERLVVVAETRKRDPDALERLRIAVNGVVGDLIGGPPDEVLLLPPGSVLKTSSGKIRRAACRELYERGELGRAGRTPALQLLRIALLGLPGLWQRGRRFFAEQMFAGWSWGWFLILSAATWLLVLLLPVERLRWGLMRGAGRLFAVLTGTRLTVRGLEHLPASGGYILTSNHASYLDGIVLIAALPGAFRFVAKAELAPQRVAGPFLRGIGTLFVERFDPHRSSAHADELVEAARGDRPLVIFPEGTFTRSPGLLPFRLGAFVAAAGAGVPVVPVTIRGTRAILGAGGWFPRHGAIEVAVGQPIGAEGEGWTSALRLRDQVRAWMLARCGEGDAG